MSVNQFTGQEVELAVSYDAGTTYVVLGMMTNKGLDSTLDTIDVTADDSPSGYREKIQSFKTISLSGDCIVGKSATRGVAANDLERFFHDPSSKSLTDNAVYFRLTRPKGAATTREYKGEYILTGVNVAFPADGACTMSITAESTGAIVITDSDD